MEFIGMFHAMLALCNEHVPFLTTSIVNSKASFVHMPLLVVEGIRFNYVYILFCGLGKGVQFSLFVARDRFIFVCCLQIQHVASSPTRDCQVHDCFELLGPSLEQLGGVHSSPTKGIPFYFL
jgi:hypothetical protein